MGRVCLIDINSVVQVLRQQHRGSRLRGNRVGSRSSGQAGIQLRAVGCLNNGLPKPTGPHNQNGLVCPDGNHRLMGGVGFERAPGRAVRLHQNIVG